MIRYRSPRSFPGVKPPESIESEDARRPTGEEGCRRAAAAPTDGVARPVGSWDDRRERPPQSDRTRRPPVVGAERKGSGGAVSRPRDGARTPIPRRRRRAGVPRARSSSPTGQRQDPRHGDHPRVEAPVRWVAAEDAVPEDAPAGLGDDRGEDSEANRHRDQRFPSRGSANGSVTRSRASEKVAREEERDDEAREPATDHAGARGSGRHDSEDPECRHAPRGKEPGHGGAGSPAPRVEGMRRGPAIRAFGSSIRERPRIRPGARAHGGAEEQVPADERIAPAPRKGPRPGNQHLGQRRRAKGSSAR